MAIEHGPSPKRRRTEAASPSAAQVAQTNATLNQTLLKGHRVHRWLHPSQPVPPTVSISIPTPAPPTQPPQAQVPIRSSSATHENSVTQQQASNLAQNHPPSTAHTQSTPTTTQHAVKSVPQPTAVTAALPSPTPTEDLVQSPIQVLTTNPQGPTGTTTDMASNAAPSTAPATANTRVHTHPPLPSPTASSTTHNNHVLHSTLVSSNTACPQHQPGPSNSSNTTLPPNSAPHTAPMAQVLQQPPSLPSNDRQRRYDPYNANLLATKLNALYSTLSASPPLSTFDQTRLSRLQEAVMCADHFFLTVNQFYCLRTFNQDALPALLRSLDPMCWEALGATLCDNQHVSPLLLGWFASFPLAPHDTSQQGQLIASIATFLASMPHRMNSIRAVTTNHKAPPLCEDLLDIFHVTSPVLQNVIFRAAASTLWGSTSCLGLSILIKLHMQDQFDLFIHQYRRSPSEKSHAYLAYNTLHFEWTRHLQQGSEPEIFVPSPNALLHTPFPLNVTQTQLHQQQAPQQQQPYAMAPRRNAPAQPTRPPPGPRQRPPHPAQHPSSHSISKSSRTTRPSLFFPSEDKVPRAQPTHPDTLVAALHQAHLRSPEPAPREMDECAPKLYRHVVEYALSPVRIDRREPCQPLYFELDSTHIEHIPPTKSPKHSIDTPTRHLSELSQLYRLRCCTVPKSSFETEDAWITADSFWPDELHMELNGHQLETRRKLHHGRYLPIDLSEFVRVGRNKLTVYINNHSSKQTRPFDYAMAVEVVGVVSHQSILSKIPTISSADSLNAIKASLTAASASEGGDNDDDDIMLTSSTLTLNLFDPISACRIFTIPVRGANCLHRDCFDLETFLSQCRREHPGFPSVVDCWRCPLCKGDVRPQTLVKDGFLVDVRAELEKRNALNTRAIVVEADGSWKVKQDKARHSTPRKKDDDDDEQAGSATASSTKQGEPQKAPIEVIELD